MKNDLKYAEAAAKDQPGRLTRLGWRTRSNGGSLDAPGEPREIHVRQEGDTWLILEWKAPVNGGAVAAYKIQRRKRDGGSWEDVATAVETELLVSNQPRGIEFGFRVLGVNRVGVGQPSATVTVVL